MSEKTSLEYLIEDNETEAKNTKKNLREEKEGEKIKRRPLTPFPYPDYHRTGKKSMEDL